jgi:hypothetical protein
MVSSHKPDQQFLTSVKDLQKPEVMQSYDEVTGQDRLSTYKL